MIEIKGIKYLLLLLFLFLSLSYSQSGSAHAILEKAVPAQDSHLQSAPKEVTLMFNERLENELFTIKVFDESGEEVSKNKAKLSVDQRQLSLTLSNLANGNYTISYKVISADGHPVQGSYVFSIGEGYGERSDSSSLQENNQLSALTSAGRIYYYLALLLTVGWILWGTITKREFVKSEESGHSYQRISLYLLILLFLANLEMGIILASGYLEHWNVTNLLAIFTDSTAGISWSISIVLTILGFICLQRNVWVDRGWAILVLFMESINGHAFAYGPRFLTVALDLLHLLAASVWAGGLIYILVYFKTEREHVRNFIAIFSKAALFSLIVLIATGLASTLMFQPKLHYLWATEWGMFLLVKVFLVFLVILVAGGLRFYLKKNNEGISRKLMKIDFVLMISIICITGIFTYLSPIPENKPLNWYGNVDGMEYTTTISPKVPGTNTFMVEAASHVVGIGIKRIEMYLIYKDNSNVAPIKVPLEAYNHGTVAHFMTEGNYLPFTGNWIVEVRILDSDDNEKVYRKDFEVY